MKCLWTRIRNLDESSLATLAVSALLLVSGCAQPAPEQTAAEPTTPSTQAQPTQPESPSITMASSRGDEMKLTLHPVPNSRGYRYCELVFDYGDAGNDIYTTSSMGECDVDWWNNLDLKAVAAELGANAVYKNGPQRWSMDELSQMQSDPVQVAGVDMGFGAHLPPGTMSISNYTVFNPSKYQDLTWKAGQPVYQIVDADGNVYVVQGYKVETDALATLGETFQKLPEGWQYRVVELDKDLVMNLRPGQPIPSVQDEFDQIYIRIPQ